MKKYKANKWFVSPGKTFIGLSFKNNTVYDIKDVSEKPVCLVFIPKEYDTDKMIKTIVDALNKE